MDDVATRATAPPKAPILDSFAPPRRAARTGSGPAGLWPSIPLECIVCAVAVFAAAGLKLAGLMP
ncbi:hypothetical protein [Methylobacterium soli]|uniref:Uncharacterized protein n=1 Tax=Methylobacterium soli TaxID=553447 RepID=A0A6L3SZF9_9HYPH|nr:hypothetical protein [Methylobacterium soli]KAB1078045.1 hypothetical protein F6X53_16235 [Methylobacterium soli]GJE41953.1 hypothetical protein AEGHOMDF_1123 [Methylobacterium soli]